MRDRTQLLLLLLFLLFLFLLLISYPSPSPPLLVIQPCRNLPRTWGRAGEDDEGNEGGVEEDEEEEVAMGRRCQQKDLMKHCHSWNGSWRQPLSAEASQQSSGLSWSCVHHLSACLSVIILFLRPPSSMAGKTEAVPRSPEAPKRKGPERKSSFAHLEAGGAVEWNKQGL